MTARPSIAPLARLAAHDWSKSMGCYAPATKVPGALEALATGDDRARNAAWKSLDEQLVHQGSVYPATVAALPFLLGLAVDPKVPGRARVLDFVAGLLTGDPSEAPWGVDRGVLGSAELAAIVAKDPEEGLDLADENGPPEALARIVRNAYAPIIALVTDADATVRTSAATLLALVTEAAVATRPALRAASEVEQDERALAAMLVALGHLGAAANDMEDAPRFERAITHASETVRAAGAIARIRLEHEKDPSRDASDAVLRVLDKASRAKKLVLAPWGTQLPTWARDLIAARASRMARRAGPTVFLDALATRVEHERERGESELLAMLFGRYPRPQPQPPRAPSSVPVETRAAIGRFASMIREGATLFGCEAYGLPFTRADLARWADPDDPTPLHRIVRAGDRDEPLWCAMWRVSHGGLAVGELIHALDTLSDQDVLRIVDDSASVGSWILRIPSVPGLTLQSVPDAKGRGVAKALVDVASRRESLMESLREHVACVAGGQRQQEFAIQAAAVARHGVAIDPAWDALWPNLAGGEWRTDCLRDVLPHLPLERREAVVLSARFVASSAMTNVAGQRRVVPALLWAWRIADLAPTVNVTTALARSVLDWTVDKDMPRDEARPVEVLQALGAVAVEPPCEVLASAPDKAPFVHVLITALGRLATHAPDRAIAVLERYAVDSRPSASKAAREALTAIGRAPPPPPAAEKKAKKAPAAKKK